MQKYPIPEFPLRNDATQKKVWVGDIVVDTPEVHRIAENHFAFKARFAGWRERDDFDEDEGTAKSHKYYAAKLGPRFALRYFGAQYHTWIKPHFRDETARLLRCAGKHWKSYDSTAVTRAHELYGHIKQAEEDGLFQLIPAIILFQDSPQNIRREVGRATWRRIANSSMTRNKLLMQHSLRRDDEKSFFMSLMDCPSGILPVVHVCDDLARWAWSNCERKNMDAYYRAYMFVQDAIRMGVRVNFDWSAARMKKEHDEAAKEETAKRYSKKRFAESHCDTIDGYTFTKLCSPYEVALEGAEMRHCVASYANHAAGGGYIVYKVEGPERATLGLNLDTNGLIKVHQLYGACNATVSKECHIAAGKLIKSLGVQS